MKVEIDADELCDLRNRAKVHRPVASHADLTTDGDGIPCSIGCLVEGLTIAKKDAEYWEDRARSTYMFYGILTEKVTAAINHCACPISDFDETHTPPSKR